MDKAEALRAIHLDQLDYIQHRIRVDFDDRRRQPVGFHYGGHTYPVREVDCSFRMHADQPANGYLVKVAGNTVFCLYSQLENTTSALDAIQVLLGATVGNQRLVVMDFGKHTYTLFSRPENRGWRLTLRPFLYGDEEIFAALDRKIRKNQALLEDASRFQQLIDARVRQILSLVPEELFIIEEVDTEVRAPETASVYVCCAGCGEMDVAERSIKNRNMTLCTPCFQKMSPGYNLYGLQ